MREFKKDSIPIPRLDPELIARLRSGGFDLEIGAGQGLHAIQYCQSHSERQLVAIERTQNKFRLLSNRLARHPEIRNLTAIHADAVSVITHHLQENSLERVFLLYPNPYPKPRQSNLRWHNSPFMQVLLGKMRAGATLLVATNLDWYRREALETFTTTWGLELTKERQITANELGRTHFERKYLARGETCFDLEFQKP